MSSLTCMSQLVRARGLRRGGPGRALTLPLCRNSRAWIETIDGTLYNHAGRPINAFKEELAEYMKIKR